MKIIECKYEFSSALQTRGSTDLVVLHHSATKSASAEDVHRAHLANGWAGIGYHYYVRKDGLVYRGRPEKAVGAHTAGYNAKSIGVCFEGNFETEEMGAAQLFGGVALLGDILARYGNIYVCEHRELSATLCPGKYFPVNAMLERPSEWAITECEWAVREGLVKGDERGNFGWQVPISAERLVKILYRYNGVVEKLAS